MTVQSATNRIDYTTTAALLVYPYNFRILDETHLKVYLGGVLKTLATDYTVSGVGVVAGGNVTLTANPGAGVSLAIIRSVPITQLTDYVEHDPFAAETHEDALDKLTMIAQQQDGQLERTLRFAESSTAREGVVPDPIVGKYLKWSDTSPPTLENSDATDLVAATEILVPVTDFDVPPPLPTVYGGLGMDAGSSTGIPVFSDGVVTIDSSKTSIPGATATGSVLEMKPTHADGYCQIYFYPEQGAIQDMAIVVHKLLGGSGTTHRHLTIYASETPGGAPYAKIVLDYGTSDPALLLSRCHLDFDTSAAPNANGGYAEQIVLANNKFVKAWNAANALLPNLIGLNGSDQVELGSSAGTAGVLFLSDASMWTGKYFHLPVVATASLPAASSAMDGAAIIEDGGIGDRNLIIYAGGQRFRIDGGTAF